MHRKQKIKLLKICLVMFTVLCMIIVTIALLDPNIREFLNNPTVYVSSSEDTDDEPSKIPETVSKEDTTSSENKKDTDSDKSSKNEYADVILRNPDKNTDAMYCNECNGTGLITCPSCIGGGTDGGSTCLTCYGNGKIQCEFCK